MDVLTNQRRWGKHRSTRDPTEQQQQPLDLLSSSSRVSTSGGSKSSSFIPDLYKSLHPKRLRVVEDPPNPEDTAILAQLPSDTDAALQLLRSLFPTNHFSSTIPPIILYSQLGTIIKRQSLLESQLSTLTQTNKIVQFPTFTSSRCFIVFYNDFVKLEREDLFQRFVTEVIPDQEGDLEDSAQQVTTWRKFSKGKLLRKWKFSENEIRRLVNSGYLAVQDSESYSLSLPGAGEFMKAYRAGSKHIISTIKKAKFGQILKSELLQRPMKKSVPLGAQYHLYDLIGSGVVISTDTTSGPLLKLKS